MFPNKEFMLKNTGRVSPFCPGWFCCITSSDHIRPKFYVRRFVVSESASTSNDQQRRYREFMDLLPLTLSLAGLPPSEVGRYFTEEQIETRVFVIRHAYKAARSLVKEIVIK
jgi:hypothetical protein